VAEIVVVDDASTDATWEILTTHASGDSRIRLNRNGRRLGVTKNFERAISLAQCEWVALADQDDVWRVDKLARVAAEWDGRAGLIHHATHKFRGQPPAILPSPAGERRKFSGSDVRELLFRNTVVGHTTLLRTSLARRAMPFPAEVPHDWWLSVMAALLDDVQYVDEYLVHYRIHEGNAYHATGSRWRRLRAEHGLRLQLLRALSASGALVGTTADFARTYHHLAETARPGTFPWALCGFYFRHAEVFFGAGQRLSPLRRLRKSIGAAVSAMARLPALESGELLRAPGVGTLASPRVTRRAG
jgi:glycosyltransferase involved in cell wall biosynthesis